MHYQNKSDPEQEISKLQNLLCWGEKNISFSDSYIVLKVPGNHRQELTERLPLEHGIPTRPCALTLESQRGGLKCLDLGAGGSENGSFFKDADFGETALHKSLFVSVP